MIFEDINLRLKAGKIEISLQTSEPVQVESQKLSPIKINNVHTIVFTEPKKDNQGNVLHKKVSKKIETFLSTFINDDLWSSFDSVGTTIKKRYAANREKRFANLLMGITSFKQKEVAEFLNIPFGTIRNWCSDPDFKCLMSKKRHEFLEYLINKIMDFLNDFKEIDSQHHIFIEVEGLEDYKIYNANIVNDILQIFISRYSHTPDEITKKRYMLIQNILFAYIFKKRFMPSGLSGNNTAANLIGIVKEILNKPIPTKKERDQCMFILTSIEKFLREFNQSS
ncbi:MAG: hypothetical protein HZA08_08965 [Nitrospirae bacterium]|nr:hypothetical protein [Nitrospirota bacterium]